MLERVHAHLLSELERASRADTIFVVAAVTFNILVMFINWTQAEGISDGRGNVPVYLLFVAGSLLVSATALLALINSRRSCDKFHSALAELYRDSGVAKYFPETASALGHKRFWLNLVVVAATGLLSILVPLMSMKAQ